MGQALPLPNPAPAFVNHLYGEEAVQVNSAVKRMLYFPVLTRTICIPNLKIVCWIHKVFFFLIFIVLSGAGMLSEEVVVAEGKKWEVVIGIKITVE